MPQSVKVYGFSVFYEMTYFDSIEQIEIKIETFEMVVFTVCLQNDKV